MHWPAAALESCIERANGNGNWESGGEVGGGGNGWPSATDFMLSLLFSLRV